ncbi:hypothetical protein B0T19DRAFT_444974 [Cercophora scortea]|uniref:Uncharacterized protein n=1 Tax=Cercophora scortea TaxID=314031 RepID=A0AAE0M7A5_9PEZI|nr:hypothetical protein B0T19DRAFT_444974 [Cercophora scortea]
MAAGETRPRPVGVDFDHNTTDDFDPDVHGNHHHYGGLEQKISGCDNSILGELPLNSIHNCRKPSLGIDDLTAVLSNFHITYSNPAAKENDHDHCHDHDRHTVCARDHRSCPAADTSTIQSTLDSEHDCHRNTSRSSSGTSVNPTTTSKDFQLNNALAVESRDLHSSQQQLSKHHAGQFEWVLSVEASGGPSTKGCRHLASCHEDVECRNQGNEKLYFGCNLLHRRTQSSGAAGSWDSQSANTYTILATQIDGEEEEEPVVMETAAVPARAEQVETMSVTQLVHDVDTTVIRLSEEQSQAEHSSEGQQQRMSEAKNDDAAERDLTLSPVHSADHVRESIEEVDKLEDSLDGLDETSQRHDERLPSEDDAAKMPPPPATVNHGPSMIVSTSRTTFPAKKTGSETVRAKRVDRSSSVRKSTSMIFPKDEEKPATITTAPRKTVPRPASLLPPKATAKSSKPPTVSTFELPGEAVARRLKEQREARRSMQASSEHTVATPSPSKPHVKSTKPPTRPDFELPGEAISRRKREEREARLKAQEEEARKRREFKARPIRVSVVPSTYPRETIASRARQGKAALDAAAAAAATNAAATTSDPARKRHSIAVSSLSRASFGGSSSVAGSTGRSSRGARGSAVELLAPAAATAADESRATSSASGSVHGSASTTKRSGRDIYIRENALSIEAREQERREKEAAIKLARQEAAERSRKLSREWAEKQRVKRESVRAA